MKKNGTQQTLAHLVGEIGRCGFEPSLINTMQQLVGADHCVLISYSATRRHPNTLFSGGAIARQLAQECRRLYDDTYFERDPNRPELNSPSARRTTDTEVRSVHPEELEDLDYRRLLIERCGIREKLAFIIQGRGQAYCLNLYRLRPRPGGLDAGGLQAQAPLLAAVIERHISLVAEQNVRFDRDWVGARLEFCCAGLLTRREQEVACHIVLGYSSDAIALDLGISINTVLSHRKNLYEKLGIGTQNQLFGIVTEGRLLNS